MTHSQCEQTEQEPPPMSTVPVEKAAAEGRQDRPDSIQQRASLHEKAVKKAAQQRGSKPRKKAAKRTVKATPVKRTKVDPRVWREALLIVKMRGSSARCIQVVSETEVVVLNHPVDSHA